MAYRICLMTGYPTECKDNCFNCDCGGQEATKDMYVSINNVQRVCSIQGRAAETNEGQFIAEVIRNNLETMIADIPLQNILPLLKTIADHYGFTSLANMLTEEAAEFTVALNKLRRGKAEAYENIKEELADVLVVAQQLRWLLCPEDIDKIINEKVKRQLDRIKSEVQQTAIDFINKKGEYFNDTHNT